MPYETINGTMLNIKRGDVELTRQKRIQRESIYFFLWMHFGNSKYPNLGRTARWDAVMSQIIA